jgi:hypothetical protein
VDAVLEEELPEERSMDPVFGMDPHPRMNTQRFPWYQ